MAAVFDLINERSVEQGLDYAFLLVLPGDWRGGRFAGEIRRTYGGDLLGSFSFGGATYAAGKTTISVMIPATVTAALPPTAGGYWVYDLEGFISSPVRLMQGRVGVNPGVTLSPHEPLGEFVVDTGALLLDGFYVPQYRVEVTQTQQIEYREIGVVEAVQGLLGSQVEAINTAIAAHNSSPTAHPGLGGGAGSVIALIAGTSLSADRAIAINETGQAIYADPSGNAGSVVGISLNAVATGDTVAVLAQGERTDNSWNWSRGFLFVGAGGTLLSHPPVSGYVLSVGQAIAPNRVFVRLSTPFLR